MSSPPVASPRLLHAIAWLGVAFLTIPLVGLLQRAPWSTLAERLTDAAVVDAMGVSLVVSLGAAVGSMAIGLPLAWALARDTLPGARIIRALVMLPMVLPPVVAGTALLFALGRRGLVGQWLDSWFGITLPFSTAGATIAAAFVALPFFVTTVEAALRDAGTELEEAAAVCGAGPFATFVRITIPASRASIAAGIALAWARALGEFGATITFAGSFGGSTRTLPLQTFVALEADPETAVALSVLLLAISLSVLVAMRGRWIQR